MLTSPSRELKALQQRVIACTRCPRLVRYRREVAKMKRRMYRLSEYWGRPVPSFGDPTAGVLILGLAPAAHGGNRTGRMFTGDRSGDFLYRALYEAGFANQPTSVHQGDGLELRNCYITASLRCAPPGNKPLPGELRNCQRYLEKEFELLQGVRAVLVLGRIAFDTYLRSVYRSRGGPPPDKSSAAVTALKGRNHNGKLPRRSSFQFAHGASYELPCGLPRLFASYHPSQQNTQTGKLTPAMMQAVLENIRRFLAEAGPASGARD
jgi:uracil-DNA glycosylase family 4